MQAWNQVKIQQKQVPVNNSSYNLRASPLTHTKEGTKQHFPEPVFPVLPVPCVTSHRYSENLENFLLNLGMWRHVALQYGAI